MILLQNTRTLKGRSKRVGAHDDAKWVAQTKEPSSTRVTITHVGFSGAPTSCGHIVVDGDHVIIRDMILFPRGFGHWAAIRWGVFGLLRLGVIRRTRIRKALGIKQRGGKR